jgi:catechol 2,3-dioxygenase-like lactoylglutathione lyase family enzyme
MPADEKDPFEEFLVESVRRGEVGDGGSARRFGPVSDQDRAKEFYVDKLGFELTREDDSIPGLRWVQVTPKGGSTSLTLGHLVRDDAAGLAAGARAHLGFARMRLSRPRRAGVEFHRPLQDEPWGREAVVRDPDGNRLVLQQA